MDTWLLHDRYKYLHKISVGIMQNKEATPFVKVALMDIIKDGIIYDWLFKDWFMSIYRMKAKDIQDKYQVSKSQAHKIFYFLRKIVFSSHGLEWHKERMQSKVLECEAWGNWMQSRMQSKVLECEAWGKWLQGIRPWEIIVDEMIPAYHRRKKGIGVLRKHNNII